LIIIAVIYVLITVMEWHYMHKQKRKKKTFVLVMSTIAFLLVFCEITYALRASFQLVTPIEAVFGPLEKFLLFR
jgi:nitrogen fixation/metabolism regulation signal transduction histidine kinase